MIYSNNQITQESIEAKLGFSVKQIAEEEFARVKRAKESGDIFAFHECDNVPNPFDALTIEELRYMQEHNYFQ